jgi:2-phospho-L-lactate/phosphoenolpyruvate guanylyltransferase
MTTVAIVPVKSFDRAKQRLAPAIGLGHRRALVEAMLSDALVAIGRAPSIDRTFLVTADRTAGRIATGHGVEVIDDPTHSHSEAAALGTAHAISVGAARALLLPGDCPLLDAGELELLLAHPAPEPSAVVVPDRHGEGTNALLLTPPNALTPAFGEGSRRRHVELAASQGATPLVFEVPSLALDIDTPDDLDQLVERFEKTRGGAAHTRGLLSQLMRSQTA